MNGQIRIAKILHEGLNFKLSQHSLNENVSSIVIAGFCKKVIQLISSGEYQSWTAMTPVIFAVNCNESYKGQNILSPDTFKKFVEKGKHKQHNVINTDFQGNLSKKEMYLIDSDYPNIKNNEHCGDVSLNFPHLQLFMLDNNSLSVSIAGRLIKEIPDIYSLSEIRSFKSRIPISQYDQLIEKYQEYFTKNIKSSLYWHDKKKSILRAKPEDYFIDNFCNFIERQLSDGRIDSECFNNHTDNRLDVRVQQIPSNELYIFEIKWVGKCNTSSGGYNGREGQIRANSGINQLHTYIAGEPNCIKGILIVYDARTLKDPITWLNLTDWNSLIHKPPYLISLDSTNASTAASKQARKDKKRHEESNKK